MQLDDDVREVRRQNLELLVEKYETMARLNVALGRNARDTSLPQIKNKAYVKASKKYRTMGDGMARDIEMKLNLGYGWMDTLHDVSEEILKNLTDEAKGDKDASAIHIKKIKVYECKQKTDGSSMVVKIGEIELPNIFIQQYAYATNTTNPKALFVNDNSLSSEVPKGSILIYDDKIKTFYRNGVYIIKIQDRWVLRRITAKAAGGFVISSDDSEPEFFETLDSIEIEGFALGKWVQEAL